MKVELGNRAPVEFHVDEDAGIALPTVLNGGQASVTTWQLAPSIKGYVDDEPVYGYDYTVHLDPNADELRDHAIQVPQLLMPGPGIPAVTHLPEHEMLVSVVNDWPNHSPSPPAWVEVSSDVDPAMAAALSKAIAGFWRIPEGKPADVEDTHWTQHGNRVLPPGVIPAAVSPEASKTNASYDILWGTVFGWNAAGKTGTSTGTSATTMTDTGATWGTNVYSGAVVYCGNRYANIISHTGTVLTIDQWYDATAPGGAAGSTPGATTVYVIALNSAPAIYMGLSTSVAAVGAGDTTLPSEITTASGGLIRKISPLAHTASATTGTLTPVFTANGSDSLPAVVSKVGVSSSIKSTVNNFTQTLLGTTATISLSGDQLTVTDTYTLS